MITKRRMRRSPYVKKGYHRCGAKGGAGHHYAKLTQEIVDQMRIRRAKGESLTALAREAGVTPSTAFKAIEGYTWKL